MVRVPRCESWTCEVEVADHVGRDGPQLVVEDVAGRVGDRGPNCRRFVEGTQWCARRRHDGCLCGTVEVQDCPVTPPSPDEVWWARLSGEHEGGADVGGEPRRVNRGKNARGDHRMCDRCAGEELGQFLAPDHVRRCWAQGCANRCGQQHLEDRRVECRRRESGDPRVLIDSERSLVCHQSSEPPVGDLDALRRAGGARCVDDVGDVVERQWAREFDRSVWGVGEVDVAQVPPLGCVARCDSPAGRQDLHRVRLGELPIDTRGRVRRVDLQHGGAGAGHRPEGQHLVESTAGCDGDGCTWGGATIFETVGEPA